LGKAIPDPKGASGSPFVRDVFLVEDVRHVLKEGYILFLKGWCPMTFALLLDVPERFLNL
jgi:hypothetical protein